MARPITKTFYDWCIENNYSFILDLWDYEKNKKEPKDIGFGSHEKYYFKCIKDNNHSELKEISKITRLDHNSIDLRNHFICKKCNSFEQWCIENNRYDLLNRWDYELNTLLPSEVSKSTSKLYWFICPENKHPSELKRISNIIRQEKSSICIACNSFAQWGIDNIGKDFLQKYWSNKNINDPFSITYGSGLKVWIKCQTKSYHDDYLVTCSGFVSGERCPSCHSRKIHINDSLGKLYPQIFNIWSKNNNSSPYDYSPKSNQDILIYCKKHGELKKRISNLYRTNYECPICITEKSKSYLQNKVSTYLRSLNYTVLHEYDCNIIPINPKTGRKLPYDNEIPELKLIIEVNGMQHYEVTPYAFYQSKSNGNTPEECFKYQGEKDDYKRQYAIEHGYYFLEIPYFLDTAAEPYKFAIDIAIDQCKEKLRNSKISTVTTAGCM